MEEGTGGRDRPVGSGGHLSLVDGDGFGEGSLRAEMERRTGGGAPGGRTARGRAWGWGGQGFSRSGGRLPRLDTGSVEPEAAPGRVGLWVWQRPAALLGGVSASPGS